MCVSLWFRVYFVDAMKPSELETMIKNILSSLWWVLASNVCCTCDKQTWGTIHSWCFDSLRSGNWLAWANDTAAQYAAIHRLC